MVGGLREPPIEWALGLEAQAAVEQPTAGQPSPALTCRVEARPPATKFAWSFVPFALVPRHFGLRGHRRPAQAEELPATGQLETAAGQLQLSELWRATISDYNNNNNSTTASQTGGLAICRAYNELGWQRQACVTVVAPARPPGAPGK